MCTPCGERGGRRREERDNAGEKTCIWTGEEKKKELEAHNCQPILQLFSKLDQIYVLYMVDYIGEKRYIWVGKVKKNKMEVHSWQLSKII